MTETSKIDSLTINTRKPPEDLLTFESVPIGHLFIAKDQWPIYLKVSENQAFHVGTGTQRLWDYPMDIQKLITWVSKNPLQVTVRQ
jgi:hypothetical protein